MHNQRNERARRMSFRIEPQANWKELVGRVLQAPTGHQVLVQTVAPVGEWLVVNGEIVTSGGKRG